MQAEVKSPDIAQRGFLLGTAFAVFYAVVGIALRALTGSLASGLMSVLALVPVILVVLLLTARCLVHETEIGRRLRAESAGEPVTV